MTIGHRGVAGIGFVLIAVLVAGCQGPNSGAASPGAESTDAASVSPSATTTPSATPSETPTESPTATASATPSETPTADAGSYLTSEGYGDLRIGQPIPDDNGLVTWTPEGCQGGAWIPKDSTVHEDDPTLTKWGFLALPDPKNSHDAALAHILVSDDSIATKSGARVGDTLTELKKIYPSFDDEYTSTDRKARFFEIDGTAGSVVFMVGGQNYGVTAPDDEVSVIGVVPAGEKLSVSATQMIQAPCDE